MTTIELFRGLPVAPIELEWRRRIISNRHLNRRCNSSLIDLHTQNVLCFEGTVMNPAMAVSVQVQNWLAELAGVSLEGVEEVLIRPHCLNP